ncbi:MAG: hypothetical protein ACLGIW_22395, partial [Gammaproteobacteria bacterium]
TMNAILWTIDALALFWVLAYWRGPTWAWLIGALAWLGAFSAWSGAAGELKLGMWTVFLVVAGVLSVSPLRRGL